MYKGVDPKTVKGITGYIGSLYKNYTNDPVEKIVMIAVVMLACSQFLANDTDYFKKGLQATAYYLANIPYNQTEGV